MLQRASDAQQHVLELRSRILGLTALNAELTRKIQSGVDETAAIKALKSRNEELQQQLTACNKEISGLQVCITGIFHPALQALFLHLEAGFAPTLRSSVHAA
jgi:capsule polysaccharide export protein KpsE/RkpR